jgi:hypothetical protein
MWLFSTYEVTLLRPILIKAGIGTSFNDQHPQEYNNIVRLFQARDAQKQSSDGLFKFLPTGKKEEINQNLTRWQGAVECLANWFKTMNYDAQEAL